MHIFADGNLYKKRILMMLNKLRNIKETFVPAILNSYSIIFFLNNRLLAVALLLASFLNFYAGLSGFIAVVVAVVLAEIMGFDKQLLSKGVYSFNALITGIGLGTYFDPSPVYFTLLILAAILTLIISVSLGGWFFKRGLSYLSIPFILTFWFIMLPAFLYENLGLTQRNIFWINELYSIGGNSLLSVFQRIESWEINQLLDIYLRSLSSIFFQNNYITGIIIAIALLLASRIYFSLSIVGFITAYIFAQFFGTEAASITYYNIGANFMMVSIAVGGFFTIPSKSSYLWSILLVPLTSIILIFLTKLFNYFQLPIFSLPYSIVTLLFVSFLRQRNRQKHLILTEIQQYSPEANLYAFQNGKERLNRFLYFPIQLPFLGEWTVSQGHDGIYTHKDAWGKAFDFVIQDETRLTYNYAGTQCEDYNCFGKPVIAPADGFVVEAFDYIEDNPIGEVDTLKNWGNTVIIQHMSGLYSQLSHLKHGSLKVKKGDYVKTGDILAQCGNSGRSPYPHLHFQMQYYPEVGAKTADYPFAYFLNIEQNQLKQFARPQEGDIVINIQQQSSLFKAFNILPDSSMQFISKDKKGNEIIEHWDAYTDAFNYKYLHSRETNAVAYYICDNMMFYFTAFYGDKNSLLHYFFKIAYKVLLSDEKTTLEDSLPLHLDQNNKLIIFLHDFVAPFHNFLKIGITQTSQADDHPYNRRITTEIALSTVKKQKAYAKGTININQFGIESFEYISAKKNIYAKRIG